MMGKADSRPKPERNYEVGRGKPPKHTQFKRERGGRTAAVAHANSAPRSRRAES